MISKICNYINDNINNIPLMIIYDKLKLLYNDNDIKITFLNYYNYDVEAELLQETINKEKINYQQMLRKLVFERYNNKCVISNIDNNILLEVAHIKPLYKCDNIHEKCDINNTLLLWIDIYKYFDNYLLSINPHTSKVEVKCYYYLQQYNNICVNLSDETKQYLQYHYNIFINTPCSD